MDGFYDIDLYDSILKSEVINLSIVAFLLILVFVAAFVYSIYEIIKSKKKILPYIQIISIGLVFVFLAVMLGRQIFNFCKDMSNDAYIHYKGTAEIRAEKVIIFGSIPSSHYEYIISFEHNGEYVELVTRKDYGISGEIQGLDIVYSQYSEYILSTNLEQNRNGLLTTQE